MGWLRMRFECGAGEVDVLSDLLSRFGAESVSIEPRDDGELVTDAAAGYWPVSTVSALFPPDVDTDILMASVRKRLGAVPRATVETVADRDWVAAGRGAAEPIRVGDRLCICPSWISPPQSRHVLVVDPGLAFGTGAHATTFLCLQWLTEQDLRGRRALDYGCGSGVLALAAARLGAGHVSAWDNDPVAREVTLDNARRNDLAGIVSVCDPGDLPHPCADVLVANILLGPLVALAPVFAAMLVPGGSIALSGVLAVQTGDCLDAYGPWFTMTEPVFRDEWALLPGVRRS